MIRSLAALVLLLSACAGAPTVPTSAPAPEPGDISYAVRWWGLRPAYPSTMHSFLYTMMEQCLGVQGDFSAIRWFTVQFVQRSDDYHRLGGLWIAVPRQIIIDRDLWSDPPTISHEEIHDILGNGSRDHDEISGQAHFERCVVKPYVAPQAGPA